MLRRDLLILAGASCTGTAYAQVKDINDAINKAGRQRMLSQRMAKAWLAQLVGTASTNVANVRAVLLSSIALFEKQLNELSQYASSAELRITYEQMQQQWIAYKASLMLDNPTGVAAPLLLALDSKVLQLAQQGTVQYEAVSGKSVGKLVNIAGRQRMLSQRMAKFFYAASMSIQPDIAKKEIQTARTEFVTTTQILFNAPEADSRIKDTLALVKGQWVFFDAALQRLDEKRLNDRQLSDVFVASETILSEMDKVTGYFAAIKN
jgi:nitrate/nitrite-specific signal transduction histidine kinase